jgi:hypothetical protein
MADVRAVAVTPEEEEDMDAEDLVAEVGNLLNLAVGSTIGAIGGTGASEGFDE